MVEETEGIILCGGHKNEIHGFLKTNIPSIIGIKDNYSVLDKQIFQFKCAGIKKVYMVTNNDLSSKYNSYIKKYNNISVDILEEEDNNGSVGALKKACDSIDGNLIVRNDDIVSDINLAKFINCCSNNPYPISIYVTKLPSNYGIVQLRSDQVIGFIEKPILNEYINAGIYYVNNNISLPDVYVKGKIETTIFPELAKIHKLGYYEENVFWRSLKTNIDLEIIRQEYKYKIDKAWGYEKLIVHTNKYMTKELFIREGFCTSYHKHEKKDETMYVNKGRGYVKYENDISYFSTGEKIHIPPKKLHSIVALENTLLYEFSTPHINDTTRINDFYPRDTE